MAAPHTEVEVSTLPACDICSLPAAFDAKTIHGPWAYLCADDFAKIGVGVGLGQGQRLILKPKPRCTCALGYEPCKVHDTCGRSHVAHRTCECGYGVDR
jgi:hypothetical protein